MEIKIRSFADAGSPMKDRLILDVLSDADIGEYLVLYSEASSDGGATAGQHAAYWFPDKNVKAGDVVVLYSKSGTNSEKKLEDGRVAHFFYWGCKSPMWGEHGWGAVLMQAKNWNFRKSE